MGHSDAGAASERSHRRSFIKLGAGAGLLFGAGYFLWPLKFDYFDRAQLVKSIQDVFNKSQKEHKALVSSGNWYLKHYESITYEKLSNELASLFYPHNASYSFRKILKEAAMQDIVERRYCQLEGWFVTRTEGRLCAMAALTQQRALVH